MKPLTPEESRDLASRMNNLGPRLDAETRSRIAHAASNEGYSAAMAMLPDTGDKGSQPVVSIETAAWVLTEVVAGDMSFDAGLKTLRDAAREGM